MEGILRSREEDQIISDLMKEACNPENPIMFFPVRHHSPACSYHLLKTLDEYQPDCILIEGPENANHLISVMTEKETEAPFAIYYFYRDKKGYIDKEKGDYKCYYPFLDYSPELIGMRYGRIHKIPTMFIDLPYSEILIASKQGSRLLKQDEKNNYNDDYLLSSNLYIKNLCEKAGVRNFDEFWEKYFEIHGIYETTQNFIKQMLTHCYLSRSNTKKEELEKEGCLSREIYMAEHILKQKTNYQKILVITGGFHTFGLWKLLKEKQTYKIHTIEDSMQGAYLMAYSMEAADALNGYASGMPYPGFYQKIWEAICDKIEKPYEETVLSSIIATGKAVRRKEGGISAFDEICAFQMAKGLAALRNKKEAGAFDLYDCILSSFIKGEVCISTEMPLILLQEIMTGNEIGVLSELADMPPIIKDFQKICAEFKLKIASTVEQEITLQLFSSEKHKKISEFFHQMAFLEETDFVKKVRGPNLKTKRDKNLIREIWKYRWNTRIFAGLTDVSVYGGTVREACQNLVNEKMKKLTSSQEAAMLFTEAFEMNLSEQRWELLKNTRQILMGDSDFFSLSAALSYFMMLLELSELYQVELNMKELITICTRKLFVLLPSMGNVKEEDSERCIDALKNIYNIMQEKQFLEDKELFFDSLEALLLKEDGNSNSCVIGCVMGLLYGSGRLLEASIERMGTGFLSGTRSMEGARFFRGLFSCARDIIFGGNTLISIIDSMIRNTENEKFMELLPDLRLAFAYFTPSETDKIAKKAAALYGKTKKELMDLKEVLPMDYSYGKSLDSFALKYLEV